MINDAGGISGHWLYKYTTTVFVQFTVDGADGQTGGSVALRAVSGSGDEIGVATVHGHREMAITVTATTSIMTFALEPNVKVNYQT